MLLGERDIGEQVAATARPEDLPSQGAMTPGHLVEGVDMARGDCGVELLLLGPRDMEELAEIVEPPQEQGRLHLLGQILHAIQRLHHRLLPVHEGLGLAGHDVGRETGGAGEAKEQVVFQLVQDLRPDAQRVDHRHVLEELDVVHPAESRRVLVLPSAGDLQFLAFDAIGQLGDLVAGVGLVEPLHERADQGTTHGGTGPEAGSRGGIRVDEQVRAGGHVEVTRYRLDQIQLAVVLELLAVVVRHHVVVQRLDPQAIILAGLERGVGVLVDGGGKDHPAFLFRIGGDVGAPTAERNPKRRLGAVHGHEGAPLGRASRTPR